MQAGRDALVNAPTGSGKTLSYLAPIVQQLAAREPRLTRADGTAALIIAPTRELCLQVVDVATLLARRFAWLVPGAIHGGENRSKEKARLRKGVTLLVATPGRLLDHLENTASFRTDQLRWLVLDEADRLLDLGFEKKIAEIVDLVESRSKSSGGPLERTSVLLSATLHTGLGGLMALSLKDPVPIGFKLEKQGSKGGPSEVVITAPQDEAAAGPESRAFEIPKQLRQRFIDVPCKLRLVALAAALKLRIEAAPDHAKLAVFFSSCDSVEFHHAVLQDAWPTATGASLLPHSAPLLKLHGNMPQPERTAALLHFTRASAGVLLCTDVAARGLDFPDVSTILQYDPPASAEEYVHRVGRTARLGHSGEALMFLMPAERGVVDYFTAHGVDLKEESTVTLLDRALGVDYRAGKNLPIERHHGAFKLQNQLMEAVTESPELLRKAQDAFRSFVRAYAAHSVQLKPYFNVKQLHLGHAAHGFALK